MDVQDDTHQLLTEYVQYRDNNQYQYYKGELAGSG